MLLVAKDMLAKEKWLAAFSLDLNRPPKDYERLICEGYLVKVCYRLRIGCSETSVCVCVCVCVLSIAAACGLRVGSERWWCCLLHAHVFSHAAFNHTTGPAHVHREHDAVVRGHKPKFWLLQGRGRASLLQGVVGPHSIRVSDFKQEGVQGDLLYRTHPAELLLPSPSSCTFAFALTLSTYAHATAHATSHPCFVDAAVASECAHDKDRVLRLHLSRKDQAGEGQVGGDDAAHSPPAEDVD
jgi:hypothetical protein